MDSVHSIFNHLVLPPKLPGHEDSTVQALSQDVLTRLINACKRLVPLTSQPLSEAFKTLQTSLAASQEINSSFINKISTLQHFRDLDPHRLLIFHVVEQNAALLVYRTGDKPAWKDPEQNSALALTVFDLWVRMDACAVATCPLLGEYLPTYGPELLDVLQLPTLSSMRRLKKIQSYLAKRQRLSRSSASPKAGRAAGTAILGAILGPIGGEGCLPVRFVAGSGAVQKLESRIQEASDRARRAKGAEWEQKCREYDRLSSVIQQATCVCSVRPVEWIIWSALTQTALIIIPEEAELAIPIVRTHADASRDNAPPAHLMAYAAPVAKTMSVFDNLDYYSVPALPAGHYFPDWFRTELGVLAGRLYASFDECGALANFLRPPEAGESSCSQAGHGPFAHNAATFLLDWLSTRRGGQDVLQTPVGASKWTFHGLKAGPRCRHPGEISLETPKLDKPLNTDPESEGCSNL
ncbi:hypothetical protein B0H67DRAFT_686703 [Lasiosphaeris hirsuta]|uniref:DUF6606 domain-containing protein n=1 Tax=Lasiosphaeris hirsuta TaxID=260670 RepID=A0AA40A3P8_9PEZI|nr:hypothetical protein B0H67DRAFT_686703 [Lasiosphaeris hirsuta]